MNLVTKNTLLETILLLSNEIYDLRNEKISKRNRRIGNGRSNSVKPIQTKNWSEKNLNSYDQTNSELFTDFSYADLGLFNSFVCDEFLDSDILHSGESTTSNKPMVFYDIVDINVPNESSVKILHNNVNLFLSSTTETVVDLYFFCNNWIDSLTNTYIAKTISQKTKIRNGIYSNSDLALHQMKILSGHINRVKNSNLFSFVVNYKLLYIANYNVSVTEEVEYLTMKEYQPCKNSIFQDLNLMCINQLSSFELESLNIYIKIPIHCYHNLNLLNSENIVGNTLKVLERSQNYIISSFVNKFKLYSKTFIEPIQIYLIDNLIENKLRHYVKKISIGFKLYNSSHDPFSVPNKSKMTLIIPHKYTLSVTKKSYSGLLTDSQNFLSHCVIYYRYLDYLQAKLIGTIINILKINTKNYLLIKCEIVLSKHYKHPTNNMSHLSLNSKNSKDKELYDDRHKSEVSQINFFTKYQERKFYVSTKSRYSTFALYSGNNTMERIRMYKGKNTNKIFSEINQNKEIRKTEVIPNWSVSVPNVFRKSYNISARNVNTVTTEQLNKSMVSNYISKKIDLFLKEYTIENYKSHKRKCNRKLNYQSVKSFSQKCFYDIHYAEENDIFLDQLSTRSKNSMDGIHSTEGLNFKFSTFDDKISRNSPIYCQVSYGDVI